MNRFALIVAGLLTAFALVVTGGIVATLAAIQPAAAVTVEEEPAAPDTAGDIGALEAAQEALLAAPGTRLLRLPEQVAYEGVTAYEVLLDRGPVYVDAATGEVLYNGPAAAFTTVRGEREEHTG